MSSSRSSHRKIISCCLPSSTPLATVMLKLQTSDLLFGVSMLTTWSVSIISRKDLFKISPVVRSPHAVASYTQFAQGRQTKEVLNLIFGTGIIGICPSFVRWMEWSDACYSYKAASLVPARFRNIHFIHMREGLFCSILINRSCQHSTTLLTQQNSNVSSQARCSSIHAEKCIYFFSIFHDTTQGQSCSWTRLTRSGCMKRGVVCVVFAAHGWIMALSLPLKSDCPTRRSWFCREKTMPNSKGPKLLLLFQFRERWV